MSIRSAPTKSVILDRDGTIIVDKIYLNDPAKIEYLPGVFEALRRLRDAGYKLAIATNQSGIARGLVNIATLDLIHEVIAGDFARHGVHFAGFYYAPYAVETNHWMRKPNPGMLERAAADHNLDLRRSWMIGDRMSDVEAGRRAGTKTVLLRGTENPENSEFAPPTVWADDLTAAVDAILKMDHGIADH